MILPVAISVVVGCVLVASLPFERDITPPPANSPACRDIYKGQCINTYKFQCMGIAIPGVCGNLSHFSWWQRWGDENCQAGVALPTDLPSQHLAQKTRVFSELRVTIQFLWSSIDFGSMTVMQCCNGWQMPPVGTGEGNVGK